MVLSLAAVLGNMSNYGIGRLIGPAAFSGRYPLLKVEYLRRTEAFFLRYGGLAILVSRFLPSAHPRPLRRRRRAHALRALPSATIFSAAFCGWCCSCGGGYLFGNIPFSPCRLISAATLGIIGVSLIPLALTRGGRRAPA